MSRRVVLYSARSALRTVSSGWWRGRLWQTTVLYDRKSPIRRGSTIRSEDDEVRRDGVNVSIVPLRVATWLGFWPA
jgi:hypothetical protein